MTTLARVVFLALVAATFGAFFVAQRLKGAPPVVQLKGQRWLSPNGDGRQDRAELELRVRESDVLTADLIDAAGNPSGGSSPSARSGPRAPVASPGTGARTTARSRPTASTASAGPARAGPLGRQPAADHARHDAAAPARREHPPRPGRRPAGARDADPRSAASRRARATRFRVIRTDAPEPQLVAKGSRAAGLRRWIWNGRSGGKPVPAGVYVVQVRVRDRAGNVGSNPVRVPFDAGDSPGPAGITVRSLAAQPPLRPVTAGEKADFFVDSRARPYRWAIRRVGGQAARAPRQGRRRREGAAAARAPARQSGALPRRAAVRAPPTRGALPRAGARARDDARRRPADHLARHRPVDDPPLRDGLPDTLDRAGGGRVLWPRVFAARTAARRASPTRSRRCCATSTAAGSATTSRATSTSRCRTRRARATARPCCSRAALRWVTRPLARRLRRYVQDGGRLATFGAETLRRGVTLRATRDSGGLLRHYRRPRTGPVRREARPVRRSDAAAPLTSSAATRLRAVRWAPGDARRLQRVRGVRAAGGGQRATGAGRDGRRAAEPDPTPGRRAAAGGATR